MLKQTVVLDIRTDGILAADWICFMYTKLSLSRERQNEVIGRGSCEN